MSTLEKSIQDIFEFNAQRNWDPIPEDLAKSIIIEAAELLEHFQWDHTDDDRPSLPKDWQQIGHEVADVFWYLITFCNKTKIDLAESINDKIKHLKEKYPVEMFQDGADPNLYYERKQQYRNQNH